MKTWRKKLVTVITEQRIEKDVIELIKREGAHGYTITDARGEGSRGVRSGAWDESGNIRMEVICEEDVASKIAHSLQNEYYKNYAMILFVSDIETLRGDKF